ncbi:MAG: ABC transporter ATP-binding protein, partial [Betaproteobacteria bacterium]
MSLSLDTLQIRTADGQALVDGVSLRAEQGRCLVILGESGSGKSLTALALMRILPEGLQIAAGQAHLDGTDLFTLPEQAMQQVRGARVAMIFQEPMTSLNPVMTVAAQISEGLLGDATVEGLLTAVGLDVELAGRYPFQLSGGQRQRALIAVMLAGQPDWLIADEPTTALDVTTQAQILALIKRLQTARGMGLILITHDIAIARAMTAGDDNRKGDQVAVMYAGQIVEQGPAAQVLSQPGHPYTQALLRVLPSLAVRGQRLAAIPGQAASAADAPVGCRFAPRCALVATACRVAPPAWQGRGGQQVRCIAAWSDAHPT